MNQELIEKLRELRNQVRDASNTHSLRHLGSRAMQIVEKLKVQEKENDEHFEYKK